MIKSVHIYIKNIGLFFMEGTHPTVSSVKMADALASYILNYKIKFSLRIKIVNFNEKS